VFATPWFGKRQPRWASISFPDRQLSGKILSAGQNPGGISSGKGGAHRARDVISRGLFGSTVPSARFFVEGYRNETQIIVTVLSMISRNDPDVVAMIAASPSDAVWHPCMGPIGAARVAASRAHTSSTRRSTR